MDSSSQSHEILLLYGSQTGTAKYVAENLERALVLREFRTKLRSMDDYPITDLPEESFVIFVVSTTGQGDPPTNMISFWQFLLIKDLPNDALSSVKFTVFGLGDSFYQQFNSMARKLYQRLLQLGAQSFHERGLGDDQHTFGYDSELDPWTDGLFVSLNTHFPQKPTSVSPEKLAQLPQSKFEIQMLASDEIKNSLEASESISTSWKKIPAPPNCAQSSGQLLELKANKLLTPASYERKTIRIDLQTSDDSHLSYVPGDILIIHPENDIVLCTQLANRLNVSLDAVILISKNSEVSKKISYSNPFPKYLRVGDLFQKWLAISSPPTRYFFKVMSHFTTDAQHKEKLEEIASNEGKEEYYNYVIKERRNLYEILFDFNTVEIPLQYLLETISLQKPREYSISSSRLSNPSSVGITVGIVEFKTPFSRFITGVCSKYLLSLQGNQKVLAWIKKGTMNMPQSLDVPVIMVGPGTGVAPFISFIEERNVNIERNLLKLEEFKDKTYLLFGCRYKAKDYYYGEILEELHELNRLNLYSAFSRDFDSKVYVQHLLTKHYQEFGKVIEENINIIRIYVCGTSKFMPKAVEEAFQELLTKYFQGDEQKAKTILSSLIKKRQYIVEAW